MKGEIIMKKVKSILSAVLPIFMLPPLTANAIYTENYGSGRYSDYSKLEHCTLVPHNDSSNIYVNRTGTEFIVTDPLDDILIFNPAEGADLKDIKESISDLRSEEGMAYLVAPRTYTGKYSEIKYEIKAGINPETGITENDARAICSALKGKGLVSDLVLMSDRVTETHYYTPFLTSYHDINGARKAIEEYIAESGMPLNIAENYYDIAWQKDDAEFAGDDYNYPDYSNDKIFYVYPDTTFLDMSDHIELAECIAADTDLTPYLISPVTSSQDESDLIDIINSEAGDADCDGIVKMNDVVLILQTISNPDRFSLTPQGSFNGDIANTGEGITAADALEIQKLLLGISE